MMQIPALIAYCRKYSIQLVHCHLPWAGFAGRILHKRTGIPVVYTEHNKQERYNRITASLNKLSFNWQTKAIAVSDDVASSIQQNITPAIPVQTVLNGVNTAKFKRNTEAGLALRRSLGINDTDIVIGTVAVFRFQKRLKEWMAVIKELTTEFPHVKAIIVGDGPLKEELLQERKALGLEENIIMPGLQTNTIEWFSAMDIFMMSSVFEGLPIALLEAMSCSCAIVSTDAGGIKEVIRHGIDGLIVPVDEWKQLQAEVASMVCNPHLLISMKDAARIRAVNSFSLQKMVDELEGIYTSVLPQHHSFANTSDSASPLL